MRPETETELAELVAGAAGPLRIIGGGTRDIGRPVNGEVLSVAGLTGVELYEPGALTLVARAGTPLAEIEALLATENQRLAFEPMDHRSLLGSKGVPTIGAVVAANISGPRRIQVGAARDFALGVRFVDGRGQVLKNGGRVMKNVTGYDLVKLMAGSRGTLGVLSEVSLKVMAVLEAEVTLVKRGLGAAEGVGALSAALGSPFDVSGAAHLDTTAEGETRIRLEGLAGSVAYRTKALQDGICAGWENVEGEASANLWREVRDVLPFAGVNGEVWRISVKPTDGPELSAMIAQNGVEHQAIFDWGGGLVWLLVEGAPNAGAKVIRQQVDICGGHATLVRAPEALRGRLAVFQPEPASVAAITGQIRDKYDPKGILNSGLMGP
ncbi:MAG: FAD-binding protein [Rhodobacteraceae bacterium]|nr:FAD-binding protein [Paracoccaceae bacterium]